MNEAPLYRVSCHSVATVLFFHFNEKKGSKENSRFLWIIPNKQNVQTAFSEKECKYVYTCRHEYVASKQKMYVEKKSIKIGDW